MARIDKKLSEDKLKEIESFLQTRFNALEDLRSEIDSDMEEEVKFYDGEDPEIDKREEWEEKVKVPYIWTLAQRAITRIFKSLFPTKNYVKVFVEKKEFKEIRRELEQFLQDLLDRMRFSARSRDFIEDGIKKRTAWLQLRPVPISRNDPDGNKVEGYETEFDILDFYNVWFDTKAESVHDTDFFIRKVKKLWEIKTRPDVYFNLENVSARPSQDEPDDEEREEYEAKHSSKDIEGYDTQPSYSLNQQSFKSTDEVEIYEWYGLYDLGDTDPTDGEWKSDFKEVICTLANKTTLIRVETNDITTRRKHLFFPIRPLRQSKSLIGKSLPQLIKNSQHELNVIRSNQLDNFLTQIKLLFKYRKDGSIDMDELFAGAGNGIGFEDSPTDVDIFPVPNMVSAAAGMAAQTMADMQAVAATPDALLGNSAGRGTPETATGINAAVSNAQANISMMVENVYDDVLDFINYLMILELDYNGPMVALQYPKLYEFVRLPAEQLEKSYVIDITLKDLSQRRDLEQKQWVNFFNIIAPFLQQAGGNMPMLMKQLMEEFDMRNIDEILEPENPEQFIAKLQANPQLMQVVMQAIAQANQEGAPGEETSPAPATPAGA